MELKNRDQTEIQLRIQAEMEKENLDALIITSPESIYYCTGKTSAVINGF